MNIAKRKYDHLYLISFSLFIFLFKALANRIVYELSISCFSCSTGLLQSFQSSLCKQFLVLFRLVLYCMGSSNIYVILSSIRWLEFFERMMCLFYHKDVLELFLTKSQDYAILISWFRTCLWKIFSLTSQPLFSLCIIKVNCNMNIFCEYFYVQQFIFF